jgi:ATP-dependent Lon protease
MESIRIPLFPLEVVLFPGMSLPLHIFEPRYKLMTRRCLEKRLEFGVVLAKKEGITAVGCTAEIVKLVRKYPDGRMDILTAGRARYRVLAVHEEQPYFEADVEYLEEPTHSAAAASDQKLLDLYEQCHSLALGRAPEALDRSAEISLAFQIAAALPLDLDIKQALLETQREEERATYLVEQLQNWLPQLRRVNHARAKAGGNGHGLGQR